MFKINHLNTGCYGNIYRLILSNWVNISCFGMYCYAFYRRKKKNVSLHKGREISVGKHR